jgi:glycosyltransferase 2 family protein
VPSRRVLWRLLAAGFAVVVAVAVGRALAGQDWSVVPVLLRQRDPVATGLLLAGALVTAAAGPLLGMLAWRTILLELGPPVSLARVMRIFFVGYLAKYVPGKVPGMVATIKVAMAAGVTLPRMLGAGVLTMVLVHLTGLTVGLLAGVEVLGGRAGWLVLAAAPIVAVVVWPGTVTRAGRLATRLLRRPAPVHSPSARGLRWAVATQTLSWLVSGLHLWLLAVAMGAPPARSLALCVGGFGLATVVGLLSVVTPDGLGVREAVLLAALAAVLPVPAATVVALASRLVTTVGEVALGGAVLAIAELRQRRKSTVQPGEVQTGVAA